MIHAATVRWPDQAPEASQGPIGQAEPSVGWRIWCATSAGLAAVSMTRPAAGGQRYHGRGRACAPHQIAGEHDPAARAPQRRNAMAQAGFAIAASSWAVLMGIAPMLQIRSMLRAQSSREVSLGYFTILLIGFLLWVAYGVAAGIPALIIPGTQTVWTAQPGGVPAASAWRYSTARLPMVRLSTTTSAMAPTRRSGSSSRPDPGGTGVREPLPTAGERHPQSCRGSGLGPGQHPTRHLNTST